MEAMTDSPDLFAATREYDLPPKWDGAPVEWEGWVASPVILCPAVKREPCTRCGSTAQGTSNIGVRTIVYGENVERVGKGRLHAREMKATLHAHRCPACLLDTVWDPWTDEWWDLDPTDYGDEGSNPPPEDPR